MSEQPAASADHARQQLEPTAADGLRAYAVKTRASAEQFAAVLEDIAENGLLSMSPRRARSTRSAWSRTAGQAPACAFGSSENVVVHLRRANLTSCRWNADGRRGCVRVSGLARESLESLAQGRGMGVPHRAARSSD